MAPIATKVLKALAVGRQSGAVTCSNIPQSQCLPSRTACITPFPYEMPRGHLAGFVKIAACHYVAPSNYIKIHEVWVRLEVYDKSIAIRLHFDRHHSGAHLTVQIPGFTRTRCGLVLGARSLCLFAAASAAKNQFEHQYLDVVSMPCCGLVLRISSCWMMWLYARRQLTIMTVAGAATGYRAWCAVRGKSKAGVHPTEMQGGICVGLFARYIEALETWWSTRFLLDIPKFFFEWLRRRLPLLRWSSMRRSVPTILCLSSVPGLQFLECCMICMWSANNTIVELCWTCVTSNSRLHYHLGISWVDFGWILGPQFDSMVHRDARRQKLRLLSRKQLQPEKWSKGQRCGWWP